MPVDLRSDTITRPTAAMRAAMAEAPTGPVAVIGSSLGAFVAVHAANDAAMRARIARLILLAPALDFGGNRLRQLGEYGIEEWRRSGKLRVFHYADEQERDVGFALYEDAARYDAFAVEPAMSTLVFQGTRDASVDPNMVRQWCAVRPSIDLRLLDDEHQLTASMDEIWAESARFLGVSP